MAPATLNSPIGSLLHRALLAVLAAAVLCAQFTGAQHRIEHADRLAALARFVHAQAAGSAESASLPETAPWHDCAAYDAAALGDGPPAASAFCSPPPAGAARFAGASTPAAPLPHALGYLSRAPPRA